MSTIQSNRPVFIIFACVFLLNAVFAAGAWNLKAKWLNVPPVPGEHTANFAGLGDSELAYRSMGIMLQNLGNTAGRTVPLLHYDYARLVQWFFLTRKLSPHSDFVPYLASFYFAAVQDKDKARALVDYLRAAGTSAEPNSWRWLAQAVYIARFQVKDFDLAYRLADKLAHHPDPNLPLWAKQMPVFILNERGDKEAAYILLVSIMKDGLGKLPLQEINALRDYLCKQVLTEEEGRADPLCHN
ncbi:MAG: hypothetical protein ACT4OY_04080 [Alphaproteobacteria bacterium]